MFELELTFSHRTDNEHTLRVTGVKHRAYAAKLTGHPDDWAPAEGGEIEDVEAVLIRGKRERPLKHKLVNALMDNGLADRIDEELERYRD